jgi:cardiolipin synthase
MLSSAASEIDVEMEVITDKNIISTLETKAKTAKIMMIIPDFQKVSANQPFARQLEDSGIDVRTISSPYIHAKLIVTDDNKAYVGSINFTTQSMDENRELGIIISEAGVVQNLTESFDADWAKAVDYK